MCLTQFYTFFLILHVWKKIIEKMKKKHFKCNEMYSLPSQQVQQELLNSLVLLKGQLEVMIAMMMMRMVIGHDQHKMKVNPVQ